MLGQWGPCEDCPADFNGNGVLEFGDLVIFRSALAQGRGPRVLREVRNKLGTGLKSGRRRKA